MRKNNIVRALRSLKILGQAFAAFLILSTLWPGASYGQQTSTTDSMTPTGMAPGAPAGSYTLSGFDNINVFSGSLNFRLPLLTIGGRGTAGYTMTLPIEQKWIVKRGQTTAGGWTPLTPNPNWWQGIKAGYGLGVLHGRRSGYGDWPYENYCGFVPNVWESTLTRLTFTAADGTEYELRDKLTGGKPSYVGDISCASPGASRGTEFVTADGSAATFVSDTSISDIKNRDMTLAQRLFYPSGIFMLRDGTRYRIDGGFVSWIRDRNGNKVTFGGTAFVTDSINRKTNVVLQSTSTPYDQIPWNGYSGATRTIRVHYNSLGNVLRPNSGYALRTYYSLFSLNSASNQTQYNPQRVSAVELPNNQQYKFFYNEYGELARVELPTGSAIEYDWAGGAYLGNEVIIYRYVTERRVYKSSAPNTAYESKTVYTRVVASGSAPITVQTFDSNSTLLGQTKHYFYGDAFESMAGDPAMPPPISYSRWNEGQEYQTEIFDVVNGTAVLKRRTNQTRAQRAGISWWTGPAADSPANDPRLIESTTTLIDTNQVSKKTFAYDDSVPFNNQKSVKEYDFGSTVPSRETRTIYLTSSTYTDTGVHIRNLPTQVSVYDSDGIEKTRSVFEYDNYTLDGVDCNHSYHCPLQNRSNITGFDTSFGTSNLRRGNVTASTGYLLPSAGSSSTYSHYDIAGNVLKVIDPRSTTANIIATSIEYDDLFVTPDGEARANSMPIDLGGLTSYAFATKVTNALGYTSYTQFDYYLAQSVNAEDANGVISSGYFNDQLDRPTQIIRAYGTSLQNQTTFAYDDANRIITTTTDKDTNNDNLLVSKIIYDQLGRTTETRQYEGATNYVVTQQQYDALGRPYKTSNPFRPWQSESAVWTTQAFDALGRLVSVTTPDGATVSTAYSGNRTLVTDQAGKQRLSRTNALGQLKDVWEVTTTDLATEAISFPSHPEATAGYRTTYDYDVLDNLTRVAQGSQTRTFVYDSLKRLQSATNPESGTVTYEYDSNSNLRFKTDARGVVTENRYDALNRVTTILYRINGQPDPNTGDVEYLYDNAAYGKGRLWLTYKWGAKPSHTAVGYYDALGRIKQFNNQFGEGQGGWSAGYEVNRNYDLAGNVTSQTYPSGRTVSYSYDAAGRTNTVTGTLGDGVSRSYASAFIYNARNQITQELFGTQTPLYHKLQYNIRGQLWDVRVSTGADINGSWNRGCLQYFYDGSLGYGTSGPDNNGNVLSANTYIPMDEQANGWAIHRQSYNYDSLNRLTSVSEYFVSNSQAQAQQSAQIYTYDRWGNRTLNPTSWGTGINRKQFTVNTANNQLSVPAGQSGAMTYDNAGNLITDSYSGAGNRIHDAENKIVAAQDMYAGWSYYTYNANGQRVRRKINNQETWEIYGIDGELVAEYPANGAAAAPQKEYGYRNGQLLIAAETPSSGARTNVALALNGGVATASSYLGPPYNFYPSYTNNGSRRALNNDIWLERTYATFPDWIQIDFNGARTISEIDVVTQQDDNQNPVEPTLTQTFSTWGITAFDLQYWNGSSWATIPGGTVTGNNKVWRQFSFAPVTTSKIRVVVNAGVDNVYSRVVEVEAWEAPSTPVNVALAANGGVAT